MAAADVAAGIITCRLKPLDPADYAVSFTLEEWARLRSIFPTGVCDLSSLGFQQQRLAGTWISFGK